MTVLGIMLMLSTIHPAIMREYRPYTIMANRDTAERNPSTTMSPKEKGE